MKRMILEETDLVDVLKITPEIYEDERGFFFESFNEKEFLLSELSSMGKKEFGVEIEVYSDSDSDIYDPKGKARHARPYKPAILIE